MKQSFICPGSIVHVISKDKYGKVINMGGDKVLVQFAKGYSVVLKSDVKLVSYKEVD